MRIIQSFKDLNILASSGMVEENLISTLSAVFWDNHKRIAINKSIDVLTNFTKIVIFEKGDNLKNMDFLVFESKFSGILGTIPSFLKYFEKEKVYLYKINSDEKIVDILIEEKIMDKDILDFFKMQLFLQRNELNE
ncbi:hypothetical protein [Robertmurraya siralis]|uniref:hypothetical protein n=1 Tax=Robertmurraya siralis TaxID=77777 RepID=UPI0010F8C58E|nr:hypothetical protein [Robertmurraya siralis]